jgi:hypothetical protein
MIEWPLLYFLFISCFYLLFFNVNICILFVCFMYCFIYYLCVFYLLFVCYLYIICIFVNGLYSLFSSFLLSNCPSPSISPSISPSLPPLPFFPLSLPSIGLIFISSSLLNRNQTTRMGMCGMLLHPFLLARTNSFPSHYKPRNIEERIKRGQCRQLQIQIETLSQSKNSSLTVTHPTLSVSLCHYSKFNINFNVF